MPQGVFSEKQTLKAWLGGCLLESIIRFKNLYKRKEAGLGKRELEEQVRADDDLGLPHKS